MQYAKKYSDVKYTHNCIWYYESAGHIEQPEVKTVSNIKTKFWSHFERRNSQPSVFSSNTLIARGADGKGAFALSYESWPWNIK